jgi:hypothetical protein
MHYQSNCLRLYHPDNIKRRLKNYEKFLTAFFSVLRLFPLSRFEIFTSPYPNYILILSFRHNVDIDSVLGVSQYVAVGIVTDISGVDSALEISITA